MIMRNPEEVVAATVEAMLEPGDPVTVGEITREVRRRALDPFRDTELVVDVFTVELFLKSQPGRFVEIAPGVWIRRADGPEAGVRSGRPSLPLSGGAVAEVVPPEEPTSVSAVASSIRSTPA